MSKFEQIVFPFCFDSGLFCTVLALCCVESVESLPTNEVAITTCCAFPKTSQTIGNHFMMNVLYTIQENKIYISVPLLSKK